MGNANEQRGGWKMIEWLWPVLLIAAYIVLMRWVLPRFGIQT